MDKTLIAKAEATINAPIAKVWEALTKPEIIKQWMFGTNVVSDWKVGSSITYKGEWEGKAYEDKGTILEIIPEKLLASTYWSGFSGLPDVPESYQKVTYELSPVARGTGLTITQDNVKTEESKKHSEQNWGIVLDKLKELLEK